MSAKTAEEKLREELEGKLSDAPHDKEPEAFVPVRKPVKPRAVRSRSAGRKTEKPVNLGQRVDSFIEDFERRIAESLNAGRTASAGRSADERTSAESELLQGAVSEAEKKSVRRRRKKPEESVPAVTPEKAVHDVLGLAAAAESLEPENLPEHELQVAEPENLPEHELQVPEPEELPEHELQVPEPENLPEHALPAPEPEAQEIPDTYADTDSDAPDEDLPDEDSQSDIPVEIVNESDQNIDDEFPDIPVIDAQEIAEFPDSPEGNSLPDIPVIYGDAPEEFTENQEAPSPDPQNTEINTDFPPFADVVINVDADLPQINSDSQETPSDLSAEGFDPENEAAPVTVTMPESTKTAEDKLMANIAEAMTGSPLTLDKPDPSEPYRLPEILLNPQNDTDTSPQSAEAKLIADISKAISESPIETAQKQANQDFEADISPFDEMPLPEPIQTPDFDDSFEQEESESENESENEEEEGDIFDQPFLPDFSAETEQHEQQQENAFLGEDFADDTNEIPDPFTIAEDDDSADSHDAQEDVEDFSELPAAEDDTAVDEAMPDFTELPDFSLLDEPENDSEPVNLEADALEPESEIETESETVPEPDPEIELEPAAETPPITAEDRLAQELAEFTNQESTYDPEPEPEPETQEPQTSDDDSEEEFNFMDSWGDAASTMNYGEDEPDSQEEETDSLQEHNAESQEIFFQAEPSAPQVEPEAEIIHEPPKTPKPKTSGKIFAFPAEKQKSALSPLWRILLQAVLVLLILAGVFSLFRLHQLTDNITSLMLYGNSRSGISAQSYDYAVDMIPDEEVSSRMRLRGIEGWKLVGSRRTQDTAAGRYCYEFIFMRPTPANP